MKSAMKSMFEYSNEKGSPASSAKKSVRISVNEPSEGNEAISTSDFASE